MTESIDSIRERLRQVSKAAEGDIDIADTALLLASPEEPAVKLTPYYEHLAQIADDMTAAAKGVGHVRDRAAALSDVIFRHHGYRGDAETYDDPQNANLMRVIDRRMGLPVALGIILIHAARSQGWAISGINFPDHFVLRLTGDGEQAIIDPFYKAKRLTIDNLQGLLIQRQGPAAKLKASYMRSVSDRDVLLRLQNNIKSRALVDGDQERAMEILDTMVLLSPDDASLVSEMAVLEAESGNIRAALRRLHNFLDARPSHPQQDQVSMLVQNLKRRLN